MTIEQERALVARALRGDAQAVRELIRYLEPRLLTRANALLQYRGEAATRKDAMDLVQVAWRALIADGWRVLRQWDSTRGIPLIGYVGVVATNRMISALRKEQRHDQAKPMDDLEQAAALGENIEQRVSDRQYLDVVINELRAKLTDQGQEVLNVLYLEGVSVDEAIKKTGLTRESLYSYRRRIKKLVHAIAEQLAKRDLVVKPSGMGARRPVPSTRTSK